MRQHVITGNENLEEWLLILEVPDPRVILQFVLGPLMNSTRNSPQINMAFFVGHATLPCAGVQPKWFHYFSPLCDIIHDKMIMG